VLANDFDPRSRPLTAVLDAGPDHGSLVLDPDGGFTYTPEVGYFSVDSFTYHASNGFLNSNIVTVNLTVNEVIPPPVAAEDSYSTNEGIALVVTTGGVLTNDTDPESRPLTAVLDDGPAHGSLVMELDGTFTYTPAAGYYGSDSFTYHARNGFVDSNVATVNLSIYEIIPAPVAADDSYFTEEDLVVVVPAPGVLANDSDPRSRELTAVLNEGPAQGTLALDPDGGFTYTPVAGYFGPDSFTYHASNGVLDSNVATVSLTVNEIIPPPVATDDSYSTNEGIALVVVTGGVLANDTDPESRPLTALLDEPPAHGSIVMDPDGTFTYTPVAGYFGSDSFTYHSRNGFLDSNIATVSLTVNEVIPPPVATDDSYATDEDVVLMVPATGLLANDSDPRSRPLTAVLNEGPLHGTLDLSPDGGFTYTPAAGYFGSDSFTYHARNGFLDSNIATVNLTVNEVTFVGLVNGSFESDFANWTGTGNLGIYSALPYVPTNGSKLVAFNSVNRPPNAVLSQSFATVIGQTYTLAFDAGVLSYTSSTQSMLVSVTGAGNLLSRTITLIGSTGGNCLWLPQSFTFVANSTTATLTFTDQSTSTISVDMLLDNVRVSTGQEPENQAPVAVSDAYSTNSGTQLPIQAPGVLANDTDADAHPLNAVLNAGPTHGTLVLNTDGSFIYNPASGYSGVDSFTYHARDGSLDSNIATVSITVNAVVTTGFVNGSFESYYNGWTHTGNQRIASSVSPNLATHGTQYVSFNSGNTPPNGILAQTFATVPGATYTVDFDVGILDFGFQQQRLQVTVDGTANLLTRLITAQGQATGATRWTAHSATFVANSASAVLTFRDVSATTSSVDLTLDNVRLTGSAAPATASSTAEFAVTKATPAPERLTPPGSPALGSPSLAISQGTIRIRLVAPAAGRYILEKSDDLARWTPAGTLTADGPGPIEFEDRLPAAVDSQTMPRRMFYRIGLLPNADSK
jgi:VCBS repeat-containing protein